MYVLKTYEGRYFKGVEGGCVVTKRHVSRAALFKTEADAMDTAEAFRIEDEVYVESVEEEI